VTRCFNNSPNFTNTRTDTQPAMRTHPDERPSNPVARPRPADLLREYAANSGRLEDAKPEIERLTKRQAEIEQILSPAMPDNYVGQYVDLDGGLMFYLCRCTSGKVIISIGEPATIDDLTWPADQRIADHVPNISDVVRSNGNGALLHHDTEAVG
jgi:hypothetical protein